MEILFEVDTPNGVRVRTTDVYWEKIIKLKHPSMKAEEERVKLTLHSPDEIRQSKKDKGILLYYRQFKPFFICVVVKVANGEGFIVTTYKTEKIKEGERVWQR